MKWMKKNEGSGNIGFYEGFYNIYSLFLSKNQLSIDKIKWDKEIVATCYMSSGDIASCVWKVSEWRHLQLTTKNIIINQSKFSIANKY